MAGPGRLRSASGGLDRLDLWWLAGLLALGVVLPLVIGAASGSLDIARNDDWSYRRIAINLFETGRVELDGTAGPTLIGQVVIAQPFLWLSGGEPWGLTVVGALFDAIAVAAGYVLVRRLLPRQHAALAILLVPFFPGYLPYAVSFMTDVPAMAAELVCLGLGIVAIERRPVDSRWLLASIVVGAIGFTIREFAIAAPASVLLVALLLEPRRIGHWLTGIGIAVACVAFYEWRTHLPGRLGIGLDPISTESTQRVRLAVSSLAFALVPAAIVSCASWWRRWRAVDIALGAGIGLLLAADRTISLIATGAMPQVLLDNLMTQWGTPGPFVLVGGRPVLFPDPIWAALNGLALVATVVLLGTGAGMLGAHLRHGSLAPKLLRARLGSATGVLVVFAASMSLGLVVSGLFWTMIDRYLWVLVPPVAALLLAAPAEPAARSPRSPGPAVSAPTLVNASRPSARPAAVAIVAIALIAVLGTTSTAILLNSDAFDGARWKRGEALIERGVPAESVDAGFEWVGAHAPGLADWAHTVSALTWWTAVWPEFRLCGVVASTPQQLDRGQLERIDVEAYRLLLFSGPEEPLYMYRVSNPGCP